MANNQQCASHGGKSVVLSMMVVVMLASAVDSRQMSSCRVATELLKHGFQWHELGKWVCIVMRESGGNTAAINWYNTDGSIDYGLFQINSRYWCGAYGRGGGCNIPCKDLLDDNIADDVSCARHIERTQGITAWVAWNNNCKYQSWHGKPC